MIKQKYILIVKNKLNIENTIFIIKDIIQPNGKTNLEELFKKLEKMITNERSNSQKAIFILTDGDVNIFNNLKKNLIF